MSQPSTGARPDATGHVEEVRAAVQGLLPRALDDLRTLVAVPSVADERLYPRAECERAARWVADAFRAEGIDTRLEVTPDGSQVVLGHRPAPDGAPTVLLYAHYDVQPPLDDAAWTSPPFELTERDGRLYGRGAADCKGNVVTHLTALRACAPSVSTTSPSGSGSSSRVPRSRGRAASTGGSRRTPGARGRRDAGQDTGNAELGLPTLTVTLRGAANVVVHVEALEGEIHSGMFGGAAPMRSRPSSRSSRACATSTATRPSTACRPPSRTARGTASRTTRTSSAATRACSTASGSSGPAASPTGCGRGPS